MPVNKGQRSTKISFNNAKSPIDDGNVPDISFNDKIKNSILERYDISDGIVPVKLFASLYVEKEKGKNKNTYRYKFSSDKRKTAQ